LKSQQKVMLHLNKKEKISVYIVDDDDLHLRILEKNFKASTSYEIHTVTSGEYFLRDFLVRQSTKSNSKKNHQVVVLDYFLKTADNKDAKNGLEVLKTIKEIDPNVDVIMLSGIDDVEIATTCMRYGAANFILKNENSFQRIHNNIKWMISEKNLNRKHKGSKNILILLILILIVFFISALALFVLYPDLF